MLMHGCAVCNLTALCTTQFIHTFLCTDESVCNSIYGTKDESVCNAEYNVTKSYFSSAVGTAS